MGNSIMATNRAQLYKYKGNRCASCGESVENMVKRYGTFNRMIEFNHIDPKSKHKDYDNLIRRVISTEQIDEVDKCVLLCRKCHGILHAQNIDGYMEITVNFDGRNVSQKLNGQFIVDKLDKEITFLSNQKLLLEPYLVKVGGEPEKVLCALELETESFLASRFLNLESHKSIVIQSIDGKRELMKAEYIEGRKAKFSQALGFPIFMMQLSENEGDPPYLWIRNGMLLTKNGEIIIKGTISCEVKLATKLA